MKRILPILLHISIMVAVFAVAGVYSSRISALAGDEVLVKSSVDNNGSHPQVVDDMYYLYSPYAASRRIAAKNYAQSCYLDTETLPQMCKTYVKPQLPRRIDRTANCPFAPKLCRTQDKNIRIDTGLLDSHVDLGINSPESDRFQVRHVLHCAPLATEGFVERRNLTIGAYSVPYSFSRYGSFPYYDTNYTHAERVPMKGIWKITGRLGSTISKYAIRCV